MYVYVCIYVYIRVCVCVYTHTHTYSGYISSKHNIKHKQKPKNKVVSAGEDVEKLEPLCTTGRNVKWCSYYGKQYGSSLKI